MMVARLWRADAVGAAGWHVVASARAACVLHQPGVLRLHGLHALCNEILHPLQLAATETETKKQSEMLYHLATMRS